MVGVRRFELPAPASRRQCSTRLSYTPCLHRNVADEGAYSIEGVAALEGVTIKNGTLLTRIILVSDEVLREINFYKQIPANHSDNFR
jgi:hypothetical protein